MAVTRAGNVLLFTEDNDSYSGIVDVCGAKLVGGESGATISVKRGSSSGVELYTSTVAADSEKYEQVKFRSTAGIHVDLTGGGTLYLYLK